MSEPMAVRGVFSGRLRRGLRRNPVVAGAAIVVMVIPLVALLANVLAPYDPGAQDLLNRFAAPSLSGGDGALHLLGTDHLGRDVLSQTIYGARISVLVGVAATVLSGFIGVMIGLVSGFSGGRIDQLLMRLTDVQLAFPTILLLLALVTVIGPGLVNVIVLLGISGWVSYARVTRAEVLSLRTREFVIAAEVGGTRRARLIFRHILPNVLAPILTIATLQVPAVIMLEAGLSYLGLGVPSSTVTWGRMLSESQLYLEVAWWMALVPGVALIVTTLAVNLLGDFVRDVTDVKTRI